MDDVKCNECKCNACNIKKRLYERLSLVMQRL